MTIEFCREVTDEIVNKENENALPICHIAGVYSFLSQTAFQTAAFRFLRLGTKRWSQIDYYVKLYHNFNKPQCLSCTGWPV